MSADTFALPAIFLSDFFMRPISRRRCSFVLPRLRLIMGGTMLSVATSSRGLLLPLYSCTYSKIARLGKIDFHTLILVGTRLIAGTVRYGSRYYRVWQVLRNDKTQDAHATQAQRAPAIMNVGGVRVCQRRSSSPPATPTTASRANSATIKSRAGGVSPASDIWAGLEAAAATQAPQVPVDSIGAADAAPEAKETPVDGGMEQVSSEDACPDGAMAKALRKQLEESEMEKRELTLKISRLQSTLRATRAVAPCDSPRTLAHAFEHSAQRHADAACTYAIEELEKAWTSRTTGDAEHVAADEIKQLQKELRVYVMEGVNSVRPTHSLRVRGAMLDLKVERAAHEERQKKSPAEIADILDRHPDTGEKRKHLRRLQQDLRERAFRGHRIQRGDAVLVLATEREERVLRVCDDRQHVEVKGQQEDEILALEDVLPIIRSDISLAALGDAEEQLRRELRPLEDHERRRHQERLHADVDVAEERLRELADEVLNNARVQGPTLERIATDLAALPAILRCPPGGEGVALGERERLRGVQQLRECMQASQAALGAMHMALVQLMDHGRPTSRAGYLRTLEDYIGPKPTGVSWKDEWVQLRIEYHREKGERERATEAYVTEKAMPEQLLQGTAKESIDDLKRLGWSNEEAETVALLRTQRSALGRALREKDACYAASTYALSEALFFAQRRVSSNTVVPGLLYMHRHGENSLTESEPAWKDVEKYDRTGFRGLTSHSPLIFRNDPRCFTPVGYAHKATSWNKVTYEPHDCDVIAIKSQPDDAHGAHTAILMSEDAAILPPNTLFCLQEIFEPGHWEAPQSTKLYGVHPGTQCDKTGETPIVGKLYRQPKSSAWEHLKPPTLVDSLRRPKVPADKVICERAYDMLSEEEQGYYDEGTEPKTEQTLPAVFPRQRLLVCTVTYQQPAGTRPDTNNGGKMCVSNTQLQYGSRDAYVNNSLDDVTATPVLTMEMEFARDFRWTDWKASEHTLRGEWQYVTQLAKEVETPMGLRDEGNDGKTPEDFLASVNGFILSRRSRKLARRNLPEEEAFLSLEEVLAVRLYSGPAYERINIFLRQIANLSGEHRAALAHHPGLTFTATVGNICRAIRKLAAVATMEESTQPLWRGVRGQLPDNFFIPDKNGSVSAVDMGFMSTSRNRQTPIDYMAEGEHAKNVLWCLAPREQSDSAYHCGADISRLSQYRGEEEGQCPSPTHVPVAFDSAPSERTPWNQWSHVRKVASCNLVECLSRCLTGCGLHMQLSSRHARCCWCSRRRMLCPTRSSSPT